MFHRFDVRSVVRRRPAAVWSAGVLMALGLLFVDRGVRSASLSADGVWDHLSFEDYEPYDPRGFRVAQRHSRLVVSGLWSNAPVAVTVVAASALPTAQVVEVHANDAVVLRRDIGGRDGGLQFEAWTDSGGRLALRFVGGTPGPSAFRVSRVTLTQRGRARVPWRRWLLYGGFTLLLVGWALWSRVRGWVALAGMGAAAAAVVIATVSSRVVAVTYLPWVVLGLGVALLLALIGSWSLRMPRPAAAWVGASFGLRFLLGMHPAFPAVDLHFHAHKLESFRRGEIVTSAVADPAGRGVIRIPYSPVLYAALAPVAGWWKHESGVLRAAMAVLEGTVPFLVFGVMRAAGATMGASARAAAAAAVIPEGLLVLAKGVAANIAGSWLSLCVVLAVLRRAAAALIVLLTTLAFMGHPGSAASMACLIAVWAAWSIHTDRSPQSRAFVSRVLLLSGMGALLAGLLYYRDVVGVTVGSLSVVKSQMDEDAGRFFAVRWVHVGKLLQNLAVKFGAGPVLLGVLGLCRRDTPPLLRRLLLPWLATGGALGILAMVTPFALRFEYFLAPAVAMAAGLGAEHWEAKGRGSVVAALLALSFALQAALGVFNLLGRFDPISVIIPSRRWPFPVW